MSQVAARTSSIPPRTSRTSEEMTVHAARKKDIARRVRFLRAARETAERHKSEFAALA